MEALVQRTAGLMAKQNQRGNNEKGEHPVLVSEALECTKTVLTLVEGGKGDDRDSLVSVVQQCQETALAAWEECTHEPTMRKRVGLAKGVIEDVLTHVSAEEVLTSTDHERLARCIGEIETSLRTPMLGGEEEMATTVRTLLEGNNWSNEDREATQTFYEQRYQSLLPQMSDIERVEKVRQSVEWILRERFREARVMVFGSSAGQLSLPDSDIDLTLHLPSRALLIDELKKKIQTRRENADALEAKHKDIVQSLKEKNDREHSLRSIAGNARSKESDLRNLRASQKKVEIQVKDSRLRYAAEQPPTNQSNANGGANDESAARMPSNTENGVGEGKAASASPPAPKSAQAKIGKTGEDGQDARTLLLRRSEARLKTLETRVVSVEARLQKDRLTLKEEEKKLAAWKVDQFDNAPAEKKKALEAVTSSRKELDKACQELKSSNKIVFEIKRIVERNGFTHVMAIGRSKVPVVKARAPQRLWSPSGEPCSIDISVNNLVAVHNTRLLSTYTNLDPRCRRVLYLVKDWAKARNVNDAAQGTLSSYGHCVTVLHYLIRAGVVPCRLKEHSSLANATKENTHKGGKNKDDRGSKDGVDDNASATSSSPPLLVEGIDVSFNDDPNLQGTPSARPLDSATPTDASSRVVRQRTYSPSKSSAQGTSKTDPLSKNACDEDDTLETSEQAQCCDLLAGYFRYMAVTFQHTSQVMSLRPKGILCKADAWSRQKLWRTSIEDPFETFDSVNPHDLGCVVTASGQQKLHKEWKRAHIMTAKGGVAALEELLTPINASKKGGGQTQGQKRDRRRDGVAGKPGIRKGKHANGNIGNNANNGNNAHNGNNANEPQSVRSTKGKGNDPPQNRQLWTPGQGASVQQRPGEGQYPTPLSNSYGSYNAETAGRGYRGGYVSQGPSTANAMQAYSAPYVQLTGSAVGGYGTPGPYVQQAQTSAMQAQMMKAQAMQPRAVYGQGGQGYPVPAQAYGGPPQGYQQGGPAGFPRGGSVRGRGDGAGRGRRKGRGGRGRGRGRGRGATSA